MEAPWKHHPWDGAAVGVAAAARGVDTFVFKGGVTYRGVLTAPGRDPSAQLVRLTRDPGWGEGPAVLAGSRRLGGFRRGAHAKMPDGGKVWMVDLDVAPRSLWMVGPDGGSRRIPLARHPNWTSQAEDHKAGWFSWTNEQHPFQAAEGWSSNDSVHLKGLDPDFVVGALVYSEFGWVMGTPYPTPVRQYDPRDGAVQFAGWTGGGNAGVIHRGMRYYLEDKPQYLDDPDGEFWFDRKGSGGTLYVRLPGDADPNGVRLEAGFRPVLIEAGEARQLEISGLDFRWTSMSWDLAVAAWDFGSKPYGIRADACPAAIRVRGDADGVRIAHCRFEDVAKGIDMRPVMAGQAKNYLFNNIAWGKSGDPTSPLVNCSAFQEIHSFQNTFFNNTVHNFVMGSRRQAPEAGRNKFIGNVWHDIGDRVFRHSDPAKAPREANADDAGQQGGAFDLGTNAYALNVFHNINRDRFGTYLPDGGWIATPEDFGAILAASGALAGSVGVVDAMPTLVDPGAGDFRLRKGSAAVDGGGRVFVPWALAAVVAEWNFYPAGDDPTRIIDEHWFARDYLTDREWYRHQPMYPLTAVNIQRSDYVRGPLENFTAGALKLDPARRTHAVLSDAVLDRPLTRGMATRARHGQDPAVREIVFAGRDLRNAEMHDGNFLIEAVFQAEGDGVLVRKMSGAGYEVVIADGQAVFAVEGNQGARAEVRSRSTLADGEWHHLLVEADRARDALRVYVDGKLDASGAGIGAASLENAGDLWVGGTSEGGYLAGTLEFLRIGLATLEESRTTIEELYAWEFQGPALRDFSGQPPRGAGRDAGAIESH